MARKRENFDIPTFTELTIPGVQALLKLDGSGSIEEINTKVYKKNYPTKFYKFLWERMAQQAKLIMTEGRCKSIFMKSTSDMQPDNFTLTNLVND